MTPTGSTLRLSASAIGLWRVCAFACAATVLAACTTRSQETTASVPSDYRQRHPIVISEADHTVRVFVGTKRGGLSGPQRADVWGFAQDWKRESTGGVAIDVPTGTPNARAAADSLREIESLLTSAGVPGNAIATRPYQPADPTMLATIKLNFSRIAANAGPCGLWPYDLGPAFGRNYSENVPYWNHGCASQRNLAAMVDNPEDLVQPRAETPAYEGRRTVILDKYRKGDSTATNYPNPDKGKITDIGK